MSCTKHILNICTNCLAPEKNPRGGHYYSGFTDKDLIEGLREQVTWPNSLNRNLNPDLAEIKAQAYGLLVFCVFKPGGFSSPL